jgi:hypothetical protein
MVYAVCLEDLQEPRNRKEQERIDGDDGRQRQG